jgi:predicted alpha/beta superfamily hydrolase
MTIHRALGIALLVTATLFAHAEPVTLPRTTIRDLRAKANGIDYRLSISLPPGYATSKERYPVIYLLDSGYSFAIAHNVVEHLAERQHLPWAIVVGIGYGGPPQYRFHRTRDYTPTHTLKVTPGTEHQAPFQKHSGGGPKFRDFLRGELIPLIDRTYRTTSERVLAGHSYGGLFGTWMLLTAPEVFTGYIVVSPSLWYDERMLFGLVGKGPLRGRAYLAAGAMENAVMGTDVREMAGRLRTRGGVEVRHEVLEGETHNSIFPGAFSRGIRWVLNGR